VTAAQLVALVPAMGSLTHCLLSCPTAGDVAAVWLQTPNTAAAALRPASSVAAGAVDGKRPAFSMLPSAAANADLPGATDGPSRYHTFRVWQVNE
jgi:hypothetical protein